MELLLSKVADLSTRDKKGKTALDFSGENKCNKTVLPSTVPTSIPFGP